MAQHGEDDIMTEQVTLSRAAYVQLQEVISSLLAKQQQLEAKINTATLTPISTPVSVPTQHHALSHPSEPKAAPLISSLEKQVNYAYFRHNVNKYSAFSLPSSHLMKRR